jgi:trans-2,3-dihydro-3-hydroxyanthranilate isomerase
MTDGLAFQLVGVFGDEPLQGNPAAVFLDAGALSDAMIRLLANSIGGTGSAFVGPASQPGAVACVRSFIADEATPFLTHPILGALHALVQTGALAPPAGEWLRVEVPGGFVPARLDGRAGAATTWSVRLETEPSEKLVPDLKTLMKSTLLVHDDFDLILPIERAGAFLLVPMSSHESLRRVTPDDRALQAYAKARNVRAIAFFFVESRRPARVSARVLAPTFPMSEDAVTGSLHGALAPYLVANDVIEGDDGESSYEVSQGDRFGRMGRLQVRLRKKKRVASDVEVSGACCTWIDATARRSV